MTPGVVVLNTRTDKGGLVRQRAGGGGGGSVACNRRVTEGLEGLEKCCGRWLGVDRERSAGDANAPRGAVDSEPQACDSLDLARQQRATMLGAN
jgi:hypothetical protein